MYQNFTGNSRRPRQVNLSGRPTNPFASASSSSSLNAPGPHSAIASAQADRANRAQQRERLQASSSIQRVWRAHTARRKTFKAWRQVWDETEERGSSASQSQGRGGAYDRAEDSLRQLNRLLLFYNAKEDVRRLTWYGMRQMATSDAVSCEGGPWPKAYLKIERACVSALRVRKGSDEELDRVTLTMLAFAVRRTQLDKREAIRYYETLTGLQGMSEEHLQNALLAPLENSPGAYAGLAILLARPLDRHMLGLLRSSIDAQALAEVFLTLQDPTSEGTPRSRLWFLGNTLFLTSKARTQAWTVVTARLLGSLADDVDFEGTAIDLDNIEFDKEVLAKISSGLPLNSFLSEQISSLINQDSVRNLLIPQQSSSNVAGAGNARVLAEYALTLLRCFPRRADDIRMWLYLGPTRSSDMGATQYFWNSARGSTVFDTVSKNSRSVVQLIKASNPTSSLREDWTVILVFLELYTFLLKIMDDEDFVGSGSRTTAIPLDDVAELVTFLKNLGFTLYFNASELNNDDGIGDHSNLSLSSHFGGAPASTASKIADEKKPVTVAGLPGLTIDYLKGLVTGLLRAIYERDSRRKFLPAQHWLMTSRFDMTSFIPGVVAEEESRHVVQSQDDEDKDDESEDEDIMDHTPRARGHAAALRSQEARARAQRKASRKRFLQSVAPRLEILQNMPFFIPFTTRVEIFRQFVRMDQEKRRNGNVDPDMWRHSMMLNMAANGMPPRELVRHSAKIRRKNEFSDAFEQFYQLGPDLKEPIQISFVDEFDMPEAGIDGGGVTKEFLTSVITQAFDPEKQEEGGLEKFFIENDKHLLYPNPTILEELKLRWTTRGYSEGHKAIRSATKDLLQQYEFLGRIIGKCLYEGILVDVSFAGFFLKKWALTGGTGSAPMETGYRANVNDLRELDSDLYRGLLSLKNCAPEDVESLGLTFTVDDMVDRGGGQHEVIERELIPNGANTPVTAENRLLYISKMSRYRLQGQSHTQTNFFLKGISAIIQPSWLSMFNQSELQTLIGGAAAEINVADLRRNTLYGGTYVIGDDGLEHPSIQLFWSVMAKLPDADRRSVLKFVTSTPRGPLLGFSSLNPPFSIRDSGSDENRFPTTSTCVNLLKLPMYRSEDVLREKLLAAVNSGAGFDLS